MEYAELIQTTQEILRRKILTKEAGNDYRNTFVDVSFLDSYGRAPTLDDLRSGNSRAMAFITEDDSGNTIRTVPSHKSPFRVYARWLDVDVYVFVRAPNLKDVQIKGWLTKQQVEQAPIHWFEDDEGKRTDYCHEVDRVFMAAMPEEFNFVEQCDHSRAVWDYTHEGWECFICGRLVYDEAEIRWYERYLARQQTEQESSG